MSEFELAQHVLWKMVITYLIAQCIHVTKQNISVARHCKQA